MFTTPVAIAVTKPVGLTVAIAGLLVLQVPPVGVAVKLVVDPRQRELLPEITADVLTVTVRNALHPPEE
jgi:hypothetical protein